MKAKRVHKSKVAAVHKTKPAGRLEVAVRRGPTTALARQDAFDLRRPWDAWAARPFELLRQMRQEVDRILGGLGLGGESAGWTPALEVLEREDSLVVRAELPGIGEDDVKLRLTDEGLVMEGERKAETAERREGLFGSERSYGRFRRVVPLPEGVEAESVKASFKNGVLEVILPLRADRPRSRRIPVEVVRS
jgi:HSP20 family protein